MIFDESKLKDLCSLRISRDWKLAEDGFPDFLTLVEARDKARNETWITENMEMLKKRLNGFPSSKRKRAAWKRETESLMNSLILTEPIADISHALDRQTLSSFQEKLKELIVRIRSFDPVLSLADMGQAVRNYLVYAIFREQNGLPQLCTPAIFGYSMLYPYTDNYIDDPALNMEEKQRYNLLIHHKLSGLETAPANPHQEKTLRLLDAVEESYPRTRDTDIYAGLLLMLRAQQDSLRQRDGSGDILDISIYKGGLSVLIDRYLIDLPMTDEDIAFYLGFGLVLQLADDLQDIAQDAENHSETLFTLACGPWGPLRPETSPATTSTETSAATSTVKNAPQERGAERILNRLFFFTRDLFASYPAKNQAFHRFLAENCHRLLLFSAWGSAQYFSRDYMARLEAFLPVSSGFLKELKDGMPTGNLAGKEQKCMEMLDEFLLP